MTDAKTLLQSAARCRRMAARSATKTIANKFLALARDYEEHAERARKGVVIIDLNGPDDEASAPLPVARPKVAI